jgi:hypothetical protein
MELASRFQGGGSSWSEDYWGGILAHGYSNFREYTLEQLEVLTSKFGSFESPEHHLSYVIYPASAHYFCGEIAISDRYTTVRVPAWDSEIVDLVYSIENSTLKYSHFALRTRNVQRKEMVLQAYLLKKFSPSLYQIPVRGIHPATVLAGEAPYQLERAYRALIRKITAGFGASRSAPLEDWDSWLLDQNRPFVLDMLESPETCIGDFVEPDFIGKTIRDREVRMLGKLLTFEIILRLIRSGWRRFW